MWMANCKQHNLKILLWLWGLYNLIADEKQSQDDTIYITNNSNNTALNLSGSVPTKGQLFIVGVYCHINMWPVGPAI